MPGGRAVVGGLLVTLAVLGVVVAHLTATAAPDQRYLVAAVDLPTGALLADETAVADAFRAVAIDLPDDLAGRAVAEGAAADLVGRRLTAALASGDLLLASVLAAAGTDPGTTAFSFAVPPEAAVGGTLVAGDHVDVVATVGSGRDATTAYIVRAAPVTDVASTDGGIGGATVQLTVALDDAAEVQALAHALATATVVVVRSPDRTDAVPPPYRFGAGAAADRAEPDLADADGTDPGDGSDGTEP